MAGYSLPFVAREPSSADSRTYGLTEVFIDATSANLRLSDDSGVNGASAVPGTERGETRDWERFA
jgi:hypothetical protein